MIFIGVDVGLTGAMAALDHNGQVMQLADIPTMANGSGKAKVKARINGKALFDLLLEWCPASETALVLIESVNSMPGQGVATTMSLGHSLGVVETAVACARFPYELVTARKWKSHFNLGSDKEQARALAIQLFPTMPLDRKKDHNRSEALLLAKFALDTRA